MIGRLVLLAGAAAAAAGAIVFGRRRARQQARARRRAERQAKRIRAEGTLRPGAAVHAEPSVAEPPVAAPVAAAPAVATGSALNRESEPVRPAFTSIKGIGPALEQRLRASGVTSVAQVAAWSDEDIERLAPTLKVTPERIRREAWVEQARVITGDGQSTA